MTFVHLSDPAFLERMAENLVEHYAYSRRSVSRASASVQIQEGLSVLCRLVCTESEGKSP